MCFFYKENYKNLIFIKSGQFYQSTRAECVKKCLFGKFCFASDECSGGLICSTQGNMKNMCLKGQNGTCSSNNECANNLGCFDGICGCDVDNCFW